MRGQRAPGQAGGFVVFRVVHPLRSVMNTDPLARALALRDLTDPAEGGHAVQHVVAAIENAVTRACPVPLWHDPGPRVVSVADNYDRLRYDREAVTRDRRYSRYVGPGRMLRSHTTARIPALLARPGRGRAQRAGHLLPARCHRQRPRRRAAPDGPVADPPRRAGPHRGGPHPSADVRICR
jgi:hypothetical protein